MNTGVPVLSEIDEVVCCASGWGTGAVCAGADRFTEGEGAEVVDGADRTGAWVWADAVD